MGYSVMRGGWLIWRVTGNCPLTYPSPPYISLFPLPLLNSNVAALLEALSTTGILWERRLRFLVSDAVSVSAGSLPNPLGHVLHYSKYHKRFCYASLQGGLMYSEKQPVCWSDFPISVIPPRRTHLPFFISSESAFLSFSPFSLVFSLTPTCHPFFSICSQYIRLFFFRNTAVW